MPLLRCIAQETAMVATASVRAGDVLRVLPGAWYRLNDICLIPVQESLERRDQ